MRAWKTEDGNIAFECPGCGSGHQIVPGRWTFNGDFARPTFSPSVLVTWTYAETKRCCHSFVKDGRIQFLADCTHKLAGQTVDLPEIDRVADEAAEESSFPDA